MEVFTIGFTKTTAAEFFGKLKRAGVRRLIDVRLNNTSQLASYAKRDDLLFFLEAIGKIEYVHEPLLAPTQPMLDAYRKQRGTWEAYERAYLELLGDRQIETRVVKDLFSVPSVLLCSEQTATYCHRRLVLEYLSQAWGDITAIHL